MAGSFGDEGPTTIAQSDEEEGREVRESGTEGEEKSGRWPDGKYLLQLKEKVCPHVQLLNERQHQVHYIWGSLPWL